MSTKYELIAKDLLDNNYEWLLTNHVNNNFYVPSETVADKYAINIATARALCIGILYANNVPVKNSTSLASQIIINYEKLIVKYVENDFRAGKDFLDVIDADLANIRTTFYGVKQVLKLPSKEE